MTDKQIIFDDVDVKDCIAYAKSQTVYLGNTLYNQAENICMVKNQPCKFFDCQFKQMARELKRKEQECEELKIEVEKWESAFTLDTKMLDNADCRKNELEQQIDQLKADNEQLKNFHINLVGVKECEIRELAKYKQVIEKIKEIALSVTGYFPDGEIFARPEIEQILQICDEVNDV